jgi:RNA-binding protein
MDKFNMSELTGKQKLYLKSIAHHLKPLVQVGKLGVSDNLITAMDQALEKHELVKVKFVDLKDEKVEISDILAEKTTSALVGIIGNIATFYRKSKSEKKRKIFLD